MRIVAAKPFVKGCLCKTVRQLNSFHLVLFKWLFKCFHPTLTPLSELLFKLPFQPLLVFAFDFYLVVVMAKHKRACLGSLYSLNPALKQRYLMTWGWHLSTIFLPNRLPYFEVNPRSRLRTIQLSEKLLLSLNTSKCSNQGVSFSKPYTPSVWASADAQMKFKQGAVSAKFVIC